MPTNGEQVSLKPNQFRRLVIVDIETVSLNPADPKGALDGLTGRIVCIGLLIDDGERITETALTDQDEGLLLRRFWQILQPGDILVGHNVLEFDLPFIRQRSWILGITPSREIDCRRYYTHDVVDTMAVWTNWGYKKGVKLEDLGVVLGCGQKNGHGTNVGVWWAARDVDSIAKYCLNDVRVTYRVFLRLMYLPERTAIQTAA